VKSDEEWRAQLSPLSFEVTRHEGTERAFSGEYAANHASGLYRCICCETALFDSRTKFESGTGWPSFYQPISKLNVRESADYTLVMKRVAVSCTRCDAHLGHTRRRTATDRASLLHELRGVHPRSRAGRPLDTATVSRFRRTQLPLCRLRFPPVRSVRAGDRILHPVDNPKAAGPCNGRRWLLGACRAYITRARRAQGAVRLRGRQVHGPVPHGRHRPLTRSPSRSSSTRAGLMASCCKSTRSRPDAANRQGPDVGTQYRSAILQTTREENREAYIVTRQGEGLPPVVTRPWTRVSRGRGIPQTSIKIQTIHISCSTTPKSTTSEKAFRAVLRQPVTVYAASAGGARRGTTGGQRRKIAPMALSRAVTSTHATRCWCASRTGLMSSRSSCC
jgi:methionine-R-sulfoxide reductase